MQINKYADYIARLPNYSPTAQSFKLLLAVEFRLFFSVDFSGN